MYLWGLFFTVANPHKDDFVELSIVDKSDLFLQDEVCQALFGVNASDASPYLEGMGFELNGEYGHWTKYYDESWVINMNGGNIRTPDGAAGELLPNLWLRIAYFTGRQDNTEVDIYLDYSPTSKG
jgi:hypothetical protein